MPFARDVLARYQMEQAWWLGAQPAANSQAVADSAVVMGASSITSLLSVLTTADPSAQCDSNSSFVAPDNRAANALYGSYGLAPGTDQRQYLRVALPAAG